MSGHRLWTRGALYRVLIAFAAFYLMPFYVMIITGLKPFGFNNSYEIAMSEPRAKELGIERISDLAEHQDEIRAGVTHEFLNREDGFPPLVAPMA